MRGQSAWGQLTAMLLLFMMMGACLGAVGGDNNESDAAPENTVSENKNNNKRIIHDNNDPDDIDIKIDTDIDMITVHTADHQLSINLLGEYSNSISCGIWFLNSGIWG